MRVNDVVRGRVEGMTREMESGTHGCRGQESVKNYVDRMQAGLQQRLGVCGAGSAAVLAAADGKVRTAAFSASLGNYVVIDHDGGFSTVYACLAEV